MANLPAQRRSTVPAKRGAASELLGQAQLFVNTLGSGDPLDLARRLDDEALEAAARFAGLAEDHGDRIRLAVGAALVARRNAFDRGEWTPFIEAFASKVGRTSNSLGRWMTAAQVKFDLPVPKGAIPSRRGSTPSGSTPRPSSASGAQDAQPIDVSATPATASTDVPEPEPAPAPKPPARPSPPVPATPRGVAEVHALVQLQPVELGILARDLPAFTVLYRAMTRAIEDLPRKTSRSTPAAPASAVCPHPKGRRQVKPWGTLCGDCGVKIG